MTEQSKLENVHQMTFAFKNACLDNTTVSWVCA